MSILIYFALAGTIGSSWFWWLRVRELEAILEGTQAALAKRGLEIKDFDKLLNREGE